MVKRSLFDVFLALSIIAILVGIALIIFIQIDRGYVVSDATSDAEFQRQQNRLIEYLYSSTGSKAADSNAVRAAITKINVDPEPEPPAAEESGSLLQALKRSVTSEQAAASPAATTADPAAQIDSMTFSSFEEYEMYLLSQNPWSPDYQPKQ